MGGYEGHGQVVGGAARSHRWWRREGGKDEDDASELALYLGWVGSLDGGGLRAAPVVARKLRLGEAGEEVG